MITLSKSGSSVTFTFDENSGYLQNGTIDVPVNSLALIIDESDMATFRKSASNDIFISARYEEFGMSKAELESWYKDNMVGDVGGGVDSGTVQTMIDTSTANYFDNAEYDSGTTRINFYHGNTVKAYIDASAFVIDGMIDDVRIETISGVSYLVIDFNTASGKEDIQIPLTDIFDPSNYYTKQEVDAALSGKADTSAVTESISEAVSGKADTTAVTESIAEATSGKVDTSTFETYSGSVETAFSGKQDTLSAGTNITISGNVISAEGGGKAIEAGRNISVTTGATADTINCTLPISVGSSNSSVSIGENNSLGTSVNSAAIGKTNGIGNIARTSLVVGENNSVGYNLHCAFAFGYGSSAKTNYSFANGLYTITKNQGELTTGKYNVSNSATTAWGDSGNTLFSVGNGTADNARHNAFEIRQNGDIYLSLNGQDVKLQDQLGGGSITIDPTLDSGSTNAVANSAITLAIDAKLDASAITTSVTSGSTDSQVPSAKAVYDTIGNINTILESI